MRVPIRIGVVIPAGPADNVMDTLDSVLHYTESSRIIVVVDDTPSSDGRAACIRSPRPDTVVIPAPAKAPGTQGGLWVKLASGYRWLLTTHMPEIVLRLDADALLIGHGLESAAKTIFSREPTVGLLGSYRIGPDGELRDSSWAARRLRNEVGPRGLLHPKCRSSLQHFLNLAHCYGYIDGESVLGGAYIHSGEAAECLNRRGWFDQPWLASSQLGEDHLMTLLTMAAGYKIEDWGGPVHPLALKWKGLPCHPAELLAAGKLITHSVRYWQDLSESQIREIFAQARARG